MILYWFLKIQNCSVGPYIDVYHYSKHKNHQYLFQKRYDDDLLHNLVVMIKCHLHCFWMSSNLVQQNGKNKLARFARHTSRSLQIVWQHIICREYIVFALLLLYVNELCFCQPHEKGIIGQRYIIRIATATIQFVALILIINFHSNLSRKFDNLLSVKEPLFAF